MTETSVFREAESNEMKSQSFPSLLSLVSLVGTPPEGKLHVFGTSKHGKENRYRIIFCCTYQYIVKILSRKWKENLPYTL